MSTLKLVGLDPQDDAPQVLPFPGGIGGTSSNAERVIAAVEEALVRAQSDLDDLERLVGPFQMPAPSEDDWPPSAA